FLERATRPNIETATLTTRLILQNSSGHDISGQIKQKPLVYLENDRDKVVDNAGQVILVNCTNITVKNLEISNITTAFMLYRTNNSSFENLKAIDNFYYGFYVLESNNNSFKDIMAKNNSAYSYTSLAGHSFSNANIYVLNSIKNTFENVSTEKPYYSTGIRVEGSFETQLNNMTAKELYSGIVIKDTQNTTLSNVFISNNYEGIYLYGSHWNRLSNVIIDNNTYYGIKLYLSGNNTISNLTTIKSSWGIHVYYSNDNYLVNVTAIKSSSHGIYLEYSNNVSLINVKAIECYQGIYLYYSSRCYLENVTTKDNERIGIYLFNSNRNELKNVTAINNTYGIYLGYSSINIISDVVAKNNTYKGHWYDKICGIMFFEGSSENILRNSTITENDIGICFVNGTYYFTKDNVLYFNNIFANKNNVNISGLSRNRWYSPYNITYYFQGRSFEGLLGNYWGILNLPDNNNDGVYDQPYTILGDEVDLYPLVRPTWEFNLTPPESEIVDITPRYGGNNGSVTVRIEIKDPKTTEIDKISAWLKRGDLWIRGNVISGNFDNRILSLIVTFDLRNASPGKWDVVVTLNETNITYLDGFEVLIGGEPLLKMEIVGRGTIRVGTNGTYFLRVYNHGTVDAEMVFLNLYFDEPQLKIMSVEAFNGTWYEVWNRSKIKENIERGMRDYEYLWNVSYQSCNVTMKDHIRGNVWSVVNNSSQVTCLSEAELNQLLDNTPLENIYFARELNLNRSELKKIVNDVVNELWNEVKENPDEWKSFRFSEWSEEKRREFINRVLNNVSIVIARIPVE
ncbi:MAG: NosD domain-containing protein, partial [Fervidobacterium sp.]